MLIVYLCEKCGKTMDREESPDQIYPAAECGPHRAENGEVVDKWLMREVYRGRGGEQ